MSGRIWKKGAGEILRRLLLPLAIPLTLLACSANNRARELDIADVSKQPPGSSIVAMITDHPILFSELDIHTNAVPQSCFRFVQFQEGPNPPVRGLTYTTLFTLAPGKYLVGNWDVSSDRDQTMAGSQQWFELNIFPGSRLFIGDSLRSVAKYSALTTAQPQGLAELGFRSYELVPYPERKIVFPFCAINL